MKWNVQQFFSDNLKEVSLFAEDAEKVSTLKIFLGNAHVTGIIAIFCFDSLLTHESCGNFCYALDSIVTWWKHFREKNLERKVKDWYFFRTWTLLKYFLESYLPLIKNLFSIVWNEKAFQNLLPGKIWEIRLFFSFFKNFDFSHFLLGLKNEKLISTFLLEGNSVKFINLNFI